MRRSSAVVAAVATPSTSTIATSAAIQSITGIVRAGGEVRYRALRTASGSAARSNVASLIRAPKGGANGRPSRALNLGQAAALLEATRRYRLHAYMVLSLTTGIRSEEARALRWDHVDLDAETI